MDLLRRLLYAYLHPSGAWRWIVPIVTVAIVLMALYLSPAGDSVCTGVGYSRECGPP